MRKRLSRVSQEKQLCLIPKEIFICIYCLKYINGTEKKALG